MITVCICIYIHDDEIIGYYGFYHTIPYHTIPQSALPYVNNVPHLGNVIGCVLSADVYAR